jgi:carboxylate-amine ligase
MLTEPSFSIGIEEEYLLVDPRTRDLIREVPPEMMPRCVSKLEGQVTPEFLQSQIEVGTQVAQTIPEVRDDLSRLRRTVASVATECGMKLIAASTHPFAIWDQQKLTPKERYRVIEQDLQAVVRRLMISGMHVHVGIEDDELRMDLMNQVSYILPHLLALSTSSPFWESHDTGLKSYRIAVWNEMPRTGLPERFESYGEYQRHVQVLVDTGVIEDSSKLWWDIRPSARFPTLEVRICDICTRLDDAICLAALYRCWLRMLYRLRVQNQRWRQYSNFLIQENRWRAQRYGFEKGLIDYGRGQLVPYSDLMDEMLELLRPDAEHFGCVAETEHARTIFERGTSAHRQVATHDRAIAEGASGEQALQAVVDMLAEETVRDL